MEGHRASTIYAKKRKALMHSLCSLHTSVNLFRNSQKNCQPFQKFIFLVVSTTLGI